MHRRIKVLHPMSAWGGGHVQTCINILKGMQHHGADVHLDLPRAQVDMGKIAYQTSVPAPVSRFGLPKLEPWLRARAEQRFLTNLRESDIAYLWPEVSIDTFREVHARGNPIIMEGINTRVAHAYRIMKKVFHDNGLTSMDDLMWDRKIAKEEEELSLASYIFAPNSFVASAVQAPDSAFAGLVLPASYGAWQHNRPRLMRPNGAPLTVLFVGSVCLRKNAHGLLRAWAKAAPQNARLVLCGEVEPELAQICARELALPSVNARGHVRDIDSAYRHADVFVMPSLEEGGPQVTFEAAFYGLPIIASPMGSARMLDRTDAIYEIDPYDVDAMSASLTTVLESPEIRDNYGAKARAAAPQFDWNEVGRERFENLTAAIS